MSPEGSFGPMTDITEAPVRRTVPALRIAVHDYAGHPFQFGLSRSLARRGHEVRHFFFAEDIGPKGSAERTPDDPAEFSVQPISMPGYSKTNLLARRQGDIAYARRALDAISDFRPDVVISGNTPIEAQDILQRRLSRAGAAFVFWMQDVYSVAAGNILKARLPGVGHALAGYYAHLESGLVRRSDHVVLISESFAESFPKSGLTNDRVTVAPNWGALDEIPQREKRNAWATAQGLGEDFVFLYSGTLALKHNPEMLWALAKALDGSGRAKVVVAASGVSADALRARQAAEPLDSLVFLPLQPMADFPDMLGAADVVLALLERDAGRFSVPSKVLSYLCAGRAILLAAPAENQAAEVVLGAGAGVHVASGDADGFVRAALGLLEDETRRTALGRAGRDYAERTFDIDRVTDAFEGAFDAAVRRRRGV